MNISSTSEPANPPVVFVSYSQTNEQHIAWVTELSRRLRSNGIDVCLDQWNVRAGHDLNLFMEQYHDLSVRIVVVLSDDYADKANKRGEQYSGVATEATIISSTVYRDAGSNRVIPIIPDSGTVATDPIPPVFLKDHKWIDFRDRYEVAYEELLRELHDAPLEPVPPLGPNPFSGATPEQARVSIHNNPARWQHAQSRGHVSVNLNENSGKFMLGSGEASFQLYLEYPFEIKDHPGPTKTIRHYSDYIDRFGLIRSASKHPDRFDDLTDLPMSNRVECTDPGDVLVMLNDDGYWALLILDDLTFQPSPNGYDPIAHLRYTIATDKTSQLTWDSLPTLKN